MPNVRHAHLRYELLDDLLRKSHKEPMTLDEITDDLNAALEERLQDGEDFEPIKSRTVRQDFDVMRKRFNVDIQVKKRYAQPSHYYYDSPFRSIHHGGLSQAEADDVRDMLHQLKRYLSHEQLQFLHQGEQKTSPIQSLYRMFVGSDLDLSKHLEKGTPILFDSAIQHYKGSEHIEVLADAIAEKRIVTLEYRTFKGATFEGDFHPYVLKQYNNRWFCYGHFPELYKPELPYQNFPLDRIESITPLSHDELQRRKDSNPSRAVYRNCIIDDWESEVFRHAVGVSFDESAWGRNGKLKRTPSIDVAFHPGQLGYEKTKPIHDSRRECKTDYPSVPEGWTVWTYKLFPNREFEQQIMMRGEKVLVLSPPKLALKIQEEQQRIAAESNSIQEQLLDQNE